MQQQHNNPFLAQYVNQYLNQQPANRNNPYAAYDVGASKPYAADTAAPVTYPNRGQPSGGAPEYATFQESPYKNPMDSPFGDPNNDQGGYRMYPNVPGTTGPVRSENRAVTQPFQRPQRSEPEPPSDPQAAAVLSSQRWRNFSTYLQDSSNLTYKVSPAEKQFFESNSWFWSHENIFDIIAIVILAIMLIFDIMICMVRSVFPDICLVIIMAILITASYGKHVNSNFDAGGAVHVPNTNPSTQTTWLGYNDIYRLLPFVFLATAILDIAWLVIYGNNWCKNDIYDSGRLLCKARNTAIDFTAWNLVFKLFLAVYLWFKSVKALKDRS